jgi:exodeoxyribonuclease-5
MEWSGEQNDALSAVHDWLKDQDKPFFYLAGYAGTGKTTLAKYLAEDVNGLVQYGAFTGKAAHVMRQKGCYNAQTIHSLIYQPNGETLDTELERLELILRDAVEAKNVALEKQTREAIAFHVEGKDYRPGFKRKPLVAVQDVRLFVIDECSMVGKRLGEDLLSYEIPILVLGDPGQLPPVADAGFFTNNDPDFMLREIHRQARDNPILRMATDVRQGRSLEYGTYGTSRVLMRKDLVRADTHDADQILVGLNATRRSFNAKYRIGKFNAESATPIAGDKLVCLRNNHERALLNGAQWTVDAVSGSSDDEFMDLTISPLDGMGTTQRVPAWSKILRGEELAGPYSYRRKAEEFDYAYAMTVHKSQGSQWDNVLLFNESGAFRSDWSKWLYTGITRAAQSVTVVQ